MGAFLVLLVFGCSSPAAEKLLAQPGDITDGTYPIAGEFYAVTRKGDDGENLRRLIEWIRGEQGQELVVKSGYARL